MTQTAQFTPRRRLTKPEIAVLPPVAWAVDLSQDEIDILADDAVFALLTWPAQDGEKVFIAVEAQNALEGLDQYIVLLTMSTEDELDAVIDSGRRIYSITPRYR